MKLIPGLTTFSMVVFLPLLVVAGDEIGYSGSSTIGMSILQAGAVKAFEDKSGVKFSFIDNPGSGKGIEALLAGKTPLAGASRPLSADEKKKKLLGTVIGYDAIAVFVHKNNPVAKLTKDQLKGIFSGSIKNWKEVGGKDAPITPNTEISGEKRATMIEFQKLAMDDAPYARGFKEIDLPRDQISYLAGDETGICSVSLGLLAAVSPDVRAKVKAITVNNVQPTDDNIRSGAYLISRPLLLVTNGLPKGLVKQFIDFMLSSDGQKFVSQNFVSVKR